MNGNKIPQAYANLFMGIKESYPKSGLFENRLAIEFWFKMLGDIPIDVLTKAVAKHIAINKFAPTIAEIRELATEEDVAVRDFSYGYGLVQRAISRFGGYREAEAIAWIQERDPIAGKVIRRLGFQSFCLSEDPMADRANFRMAYQNTSAIERREAQLPENLRGHGKELESKKLKIENMLEEVAKQSPWR